MNHKYKVKPSEFLFYVAFFIYSFSSDVIGNSYLFTSSDSRFTFSNSLSYFAALLFALCFLMKKNIKAKEIIIDAFLCMIALIIAYNMHSIGFGVCILMILGARGIDFKRIVKFAMVALTFNVLLVVICSQIGIAPDTIIMHDNMKAHTLGFAYYSNVPYHVLMVTIMFYWLVNTRRIENWVLFLSLPIHYLTYRISTVRLVFYIYHIFLVAALLIRFVKKGKKHRILTFIAGIMFPVGLVGTVYASYQSRSSAFFYELDRHLNWRLGFNYRGFTEYGIKLLGQQVETSEGYFDSNYINHYFFIDSGYAYVLLNYGSIFSAILIVGYTVLSVWAVRNEEFKLFVWCLIICIFSVINNIMFATSWNPLPILAVSMAINSSFAKHLTINKRRTKLKKTVV